MRRGWERRFVMGIVMVVVVDLFASNAKVGGWRCFPLKRTAELRNGGGIMAVAYRVLAYGVELLITMSIAHVERMKYTQSRRWSS